MPLESFGTPPFKSPSGHEQTIKLLTCVNDTLVISSTENQPAIGRGYFSQKKTTPPFSSGIFSWMFPSFFQVRLRLQRADVISILAEQLQHAWGQADEVRGLGAGHTPAVNIYRSRLYTLW